MTLLSLPVGYDITRHALHQIAFFAVAPARYKATGRMGLRAVPGGFGTPKFDGRVARVEGDMLVHEQDANIATQTISTVREAAEFFGLEYEVTWFEDFHDPLAPGDPDATLQVDDTAARAVGNWFRFATDVIDRVRHQGNEGDDVSETQLWPEHFDLATELGNQERGERASFGASPGDDDHAEPYLYVAAWGEIDRANQYWNDRSFNGASLTYSRLLDADDPVEAGVDFLLEGYRILHSG